MSNVNAISPEKEMAITSLPVTFFTQGRDLKVVLVFTPYSSDDLPKVTPEYWWAEVSKQSRAFLHGTAQWDPRDLNQIHMSGMTPDMETVGTIEIYSEGSDESFILLWDVKYRDFIQLGKLWGLSAELSPVKLRHSSGSSA